MLHARRVIRPLPSSAATIAKDLGDELFATWSRAPASAGVHSNPNASVGHRAVQYCMYTGEAASVASHIVETAGTHECEWSVAERNEERTKKLMEGRVGYKESTAKKKALVYKMSGSAKGQSRHC